MSKTGVSAIAGTNPYKKPETSKKERKKERKILARSDYLRQ